MNHSKLHVAFACAVLGIFAGANTASAITVSPGDTVSLPGTTSAAESYLAGTVLQDELINFSLKADQSPNAATITGTVQQRVVQEDITKTLDFYWRITSLSGGSLGYFRVGKFNSTVFDANYRTDGLGDVGPTSIIRFKPGMGGATDDKAVNFNFTNSDSLDSLAAGQESYFLFLHTNATEYAKTAFFDIASSGTYTLSQSFAAYTPAVPEPETYAMLMAGLGLMGVFARRRRT